MEISPLATGRCLVPTQGSPSRSGSPTPAGGPHLRKNTQAPAWPDPTTPASQSFTASPRGRLTPSEVRARRRSHAKNATTSPTSPTSKRWCSRAGWNVVDRDHCSACGHEGWWLLTCMSSVGVPPPPIPLPSTPRLIPLPAHRFSRASSSGSSRGLIGLDLVVNGQVPCGVAWRPGDQTARPKGSHVGGPGSEPLRQGGGRVGAADAVQSR